jgi:hypothetical protein
MPSDEVGAALFALLFGTAALNDDAPGETDRVVRAVGESLAVHEGASVGSIPDVRPVPRDPP